MNKTVPDIAKARFAIGAALPLLVTAIPQKTYLVPLVAGTSLVLLGLLGGLAAWAGGAPLVTGSIRVTLWGAIAMAVTAGIGALVGTAVQPMPGPSAWAL